MKTQHGIRLALGAAMVAASGLFGQAWAVDELEDNYPMDTAQELLFDGTGTVTVNAFMGSGDADVFSFWAKAGDVITVDIDGGVKSGAGSIDTIMAVHYPSDPGNGIMPYARLRWIDDATAPDDGSLGAGDSYIGNLPIPADGVYYVSVTGYPNQVLDGGSFSGGPGNLTGSYTLIVSGVSARPAPTPDPVPDPAPTDPTPDPAPTDPIPTPTPGAKTIGIDIKPWVKVLARVNPKAKGDIPIALLGSADFNVETVDVDSLTFGHTGDEQSLRKCHRHLVDVNRDGRRDLICHFRSERTELELSDEEGTLKGMTTDLTPFEGTGNLKVVAHKRHGHRWHHHHHHGYGKDRHDDKKQKSRWHWSRR